MTLLDEPTLATGEAPSPARAARRTRPLVTLEVLLFLGLVLLAAVAYEPVFRSWTSFAAPVAGAAVLSSLLAVVLKRRRVPMRFAVLASLVGAAIFLAYTVLVDELTAGVVPGADTIEGLRTGLRRGWQQVLDGTLPVADSTPTLVWLTAVTWIVAHLTTDLVQRTRLVALPIAPPLVLFGLSLPLVSTTAEPPWWLVVAFLGLSLLAVLVRAVPDARTMRDLGGAANGVAEFHSRSVLSARLRLGVPIIVVCLVLAPLAAVVLTGDDPFDPRDLRNDVTVPEIVSDPLGQLKGQIETSPPAAAFRVTFPSPNDAIEVQRVSVLHLDQYDGVRWLSASTFGVDGGVLEPTEPFPQGRDVTQTYTIADVEDPWLPVAAVPMQIDLSSVAYDPDSGDLLAPDRVSGLTYRVESRVSQPTADDLANATPTEDPAYARYEVLAGIVPPDLVDVATEAVAGSTSPADSVLRLEQYLATNFRYDPEAAAGHSYGRLARFLTEERRGTAEQFAASFAVLARSLGLPARVVVGYKVVEVDEGVVTPIDFVTSRQYHAWVEVHFDELGWVSFDPTPEASDAALPQDDPVTAPATTVAPPRDSGGSATPQEAGPSEGLPEPDPETPSWSSRAVLYGGGAAGGLLLVLLGAALVVLVGKRRRRTRRRTAPEPADQIVGAWDEVLDRLVEMRFPIATAMTPRDVARAGTATYGAPAAEPLESLAPAVSRAVFAERAPGTDAAVRAWEYTAEFERNLAATLTRRQRLRARLSPRPFRRRDR
jgi:hypothetical protein